MEVNERNTIFNLRQQIMRLEEQRDVSATITATLRADRRALRGELEAVREVNEFALKSAAEVAEELAELVEVNASLWGANKALSNRVGAKNVKIEILLAQIYGLEATLDGRGHAPE